MAYTYTSTGCDAKGEGAKDRKRKNLIKTVNMELKLKKVQNITENGGEFAIVVIHERTLGYSFIET